MYLDFSVAQLKCKSASVFLTFRTNSNSMCNPIIKMDIAHDICMNAVKTTLKNFLISLRTITET